MNSYPRLPPIHHLPVHSPSSSPSPSSSSSLSHTSSNPSFGPYPPSFTPSPHHQHHNYPPSQTEELKTSLEQAKLDQRRQEYALLRDALRRGFPHSAIPSLLASRDSSVRRRTGYDGYGLGRGEMYQQNYGTELSAHASSQGSGHGRGQEGEVYFIPAPTDTAPVSPRKRRLDLDDSFLNRAYKRRRPWTGAPRGRTAQGGDQMQRITFHHWVPGGSK